MGGAFGLGLEANRAPRGSTWDSWRRLYTDGDRGVRLASTVHDAADYRPTNLRRWLKDNDGVVPETLIEKTGTVTAMTLDRPSAHQ
ncbi:hypothetical protein AB0L63_27625 [Nocardia sp. NPDC051990]|uniref:hypothetical protein n=1 Tax=Nocardia sp. NPDC051990 TaxID=3155285 RepID=UPI0034162B9C